MLLKGLKLESIYKLVTTRIKLLFGSLISIIKILFLSNFFSKLPEANGKNVLVLANGPSFKPTLSKNPKIFETWPCIVSNNFANSEYFFSIKPQYYVWLDAHMWTSKVKAVQDTYKTLLNVNWEMYLFVPRFSKSNKRIKTLTANKNIKLIYYNYVYYEGLRRLGHWLYKYNLCAPRARSVTIISLFIGMNMGFRKLILIGADHTWHENLQMSQDNILLTKYEHFFDDKKEVKYVPFYIDGIKENGLNKAKDFFWIMSKNFEGYENVADYMNYRDAKIYNGSPESFIDAFERIDITSLNTIN